MPTLTTRLNINDANRGTNGMHRVGDLFANAAGDFSGTTAPDGANGDGTVFDISSSDGSDAGTPARFNGADRAYHDAGLIAGGADLSGTTIGALAKSDTDTAAAVATDNMTTVAATAAPILTTLVNFNGTMDETLTYENSLVPINGTDNQYGGGPYNLAITLSADLPDNYNGIVWGGAGFGTGGLVGTVKISGLGLSVQSGDAPLENAVFDFTNGSADSHPKCNTSA